MVDIENMTIAVVSMLEFKLKQVIVFRSEYPHRNIKMVNKTWCSLQLVVTVFNRSSKPSDVRLQIPKRDVLNFNDYDLLDVQYALEIEAHIQGCHKNLSGQIPITLGTLPVILNMYEIEPLLF